MAYKPVVLRMVSLAKQRALGIVCSISRYAEWLDIIDHFDLLAADQLMSEPRAAICNDNRSICCKLLEIRDTGLRITNEAFGPARRRPITAPPANAKSWLAAKTAKPI